MRLLGCSTNVSVLTSRQPLQSDEIRSNSDLIQLRAATIPCAEVAAPGLFTESVLRVPKLTSFSSVCWMRSAETALMICTMTGSLSLLDFNDVFSFAAGLVEEDFLGECFWATANGAVSIRSAIETFDTIIVRQRRSNIRSLNFENLTTIPRDSKY